MTKIMGIDEAKEVLWYHINNNTSSELSNDCEDEISCAVDAIIAKAIEGAVAEVEDHRQKEQSDPDAKYPTLTVGGKNQHDPPVTIVKGHVTHMRETLDRQHRVIYLTSGKEIITWHSASTIMDALGW